MPNRRVVLHVWCVCAVLAARVFAYEGDVIDMVIDPDPAVVGLSVQIHGAAAFPGEAGQIDIRLDSPSGVVYQRDALCRDDGVWAYTFGPLDEAGEWRVRAAGPEIPGQGDREIADESFVVVTGGVAMAMSADVLADAAEEMAAALEEFSSNVAQYPETPGQDEAADAGSEAETLIVSASAQLAEVASACREIASASERMPLCPRVQTALGEGAQALSEVSSRVAADRSKLSDQVLRTKSAAEWCRLWILQGECLKQTLALYVDLAGGVNAIGQWAVGKLRSSVESDMKDLALRAATGELFGNITQAEYQQCKQAAGELETAIGVIDAAVKGVDDLTNPLLAAVNHCIDWVYGDVTKNCAHYRGPVDGDLKIDYCAKGQPYMRVRWHMDGQAELFFEKRQGQEGPVYVRGRVWGDCKRFVGSMDLHHLVEGIPGTDYLAFCLPRWMPESFSVAVEGEAHHDKMVLRFLTPATTDFSPKKYRFITVLFSAFQMLPIPDVIDLDVPGAEWFLTRATLTAGAQKDFEAPLHVEGDKSVAEQTFTRHMDYLHLDNPFEADLTFHCRATSPPE